MDSPPPSTGRERYYRHHGAPHRDPALSVGRLHGALHSSLRIPTGTPQLVESELVRDYGVSRNTVRAALGILVEEGLVSRTPGRGTVPTGSLLTVPAGDPAGNLTTELLGHRSMRSSPVLRALLRDDAAMLEVTEHLGRGAGGPLFRSTAVSLPGTAGRDSGRVETTIEGGPLDADTASLLGVEPGSTALVTTSVRHDGHGTPTTVETTVFDSSRVVLRPGPGAPRPRRGTTGTSLDGRIVQPHRRAATDLYRELRTGIRRGVLGRGHRLDMREVMDDFDVSRAVFLDAVRRLVADGLVDRLPRRGTHVVAGIITFGLDLGAHTRPGWPGRSAVLRSHTVPAPPFAAALLHHTGDVEVTEFDYVWRSRFPRVHIRYSVPTRSPRPLAAAATAPFAELFRAAHGIEPGRCETGVSVVRAPGSVARRVGGAPGDPMLLKERLVLGADGAPREFSHTYYPADRTALQTVTG